VRELTALDRSLEGATRGWKLTIEGARHLALRMTYEDVNPGCRPENPARSVRVRAQRRQGQGRRADPDQRNI